MKIKCCKCGKIVDESEIIKQGWRYYCSDKCCKRNGRIALWVAVILAGIIILSTFFSLFWSR